jgi:hypothetical protein
MTVGLDPTGFQSHPDEQHRGQAWKRPVRCATTANITISTALNNGDTLDGITLATGDRVLVKDQSTGSQNGIYVVGASPARTYDWDQDLTSDTPQEESLGAWIYVIAGTANGGTAWRCTNTTTPTLGTTALTFAQIPLSALTDPMTTRGDIIVRNASNVTARLAIGSAGKILSSDGTDPSWGNGPMTTAGDLIVGGASGAPARLAKGSDSQVLTVDATTHLLVWATPSSGFSNPMTTKGDLIVGDTGGSAIRKAVGSDTQVLTADSASTGGMKWAAGGGGSGALTFLAQTVLGSDAADITITGISAGYKDLVIVVLARQDQANDDSFMNLRVGSGSIDTGANYGYSTILGGTANVAYGANSGLSLIQAGICAGTNATAGAFAMTLIEIIDYASTSKFRMMNLHAGKVGASGYYQYDGMGAWRNAANALDQVRVYPAAGNLKTGSQMTIYGRT